MKPRLVSPTGTRSARHLIIRLGESVCANRWESVVYLDSQVCRRQQRAFRDDAPGKRASEWVSVCLFHPIASASATEVGWQAAAVPLENKSAGASRFRETPALVISMPG